MSSSLGARPLVSDSSTMLARYPHYRPRHQIFRRKNSSPSPVSQFTTLDANPWPTVSIEFRQQNTLSISEISQSRLSVYQYKGCQSCLSVASSDLSATMSLKLPYSIVSSETICLLAFALVLAELLLSFFLPQCLS
jgi:hypothetical protein